MKALSLVGIQPHRGQHQRNGPRGWEAPIAAPPAAAGAR